MEEELLKCNAHVMVFFDMTWRPLVGSLAAVTSCFTTAQTNTHTHTHTHTFSDTIQPANLWVCDCDHTHTHTQFRFTSDVSLELFWWDELAVRR